MASTKSSACEALCSKTIGFIGAGHMAQALADGIVRSGAVSAESIIVFDVSTAAIEKSRSKGYQVGWDASDVVQRSDIIVLAVRPCDVEKVLSDVKGSGKGKLFISICAGVTLGKLKREGTPLGEGVVARVMPNTPALLQQGASAFCLSESSAAVRAQVMGILESCGVAEEVTESQLDIVTALSGAGPAYFYLYMDALVDGAVKMGLSRDVATRLVAQTAIGAGHMVQKTGHSPGTLKDQVATPGGVTIHGIATLEEKGLRAAAISCVEAGTVRSAELGK